MESTKDPNVEPPPTTLQTAARCLKHRPIPVPIPDLYVDLHV